MTQFHSGAIPISFEAIEDLNDYQYHFAQLGLTSASVGKVTVGTGGSDPYPIGVIQNDPKIGGTADVVMLGPTLLRVNAAGSTINAGRLLKCGSTGHGEPFDYAAVVGGSSLNANAVALQYTTDDDVLIEVFVNPFMAAVAGS